jgi:hypothetical protein
MKKMNFIKILLVITSISTTLFAQKEVVNEEINITKERDVIIPKANRIIEKVPTIKNEKSEKKMSYSFYDRKPTALEETKFNPNVVNPNANNKNKKDELTGYKNYFKVGVGNFGRFYGEGYLNSNQDQKLIYGLSVLHNSTKRGPIQSQNSANRLSKVSLDGKYHQNNFELKTEIGYENRKYFFYGYDTTIHKDYQPADLKQIINLFNVGVTFENTNPKPVVDYSLSTQLKTLSDHYEASELDWGTRFHSFFPLKKDKITAILDAEAYLTERSDSYEINPVRKRNLYRVEPAFRFDFGRFSTKVGFKAVNEYDQIENINTTKGFPTISLSYKTPSLTYFFAGYDGDIIRNTLNSFLNENPFIVEQANLLNTYKDQEYYIGSRGELFSGVSFNTKISYGKFQNLYYYDIFEGTTISPTGKPVNVSKFQIEYEDENTDFVNISAEFAYSSFDFWKPNLKLDYNYYETIKFEKPWHRPSFSGRLGNTFVLAEKIVSSLDVYYMAGLYAKDPLTLNAVKLKDIVDLNAEFTYLFSKQFSTFVKLNNIVGQNYQRYYNYPQLGLNFVAGINVAL